MKIHIITALILTALISGCSTSNLLTSTEPQQTIYTLRPVSPMGAPSNIAARVVEIASPSLPPAMDGERIALHLNNGQKLDYYASARWSASLGFIIQDFTRRSASAVLPYVVAVTSDQQIDADYRLQIKVNEFQPVYKEDITAAPLLKVNVEFTLIRLPSDQIVSSFTLAKQDQLQENRLDQITVGLERLLQEIQQEAFTKIDSRLTAK